MFNNIFPKIVPSMR